jgi:hypothetical protein
MANGNKKLAAEIDHILASTTLYLTAFSISACITTICDWMHGFLQTFGNVII